MLIIIEGIDCAGKSSRARILKEKFDNVIIYREPGASAIGEELRKLLKSDIPMSESTQAYLFAACRNEALNEIEERLDQGYIVILDRSFISSMVYQPHCAKSINEYYLARLKKIPYYIIYIELSWEEYCKRIKNRDTIDRFEKKINKEVFIEYTERYKKVIKDYNHLIVQQDDDIVQKIGELIKK